MNTKNGIRPRYDNNGNLIGYQAIVRETDLLGRKHYKSKTFSLRKKQTKAHAKTWQEKTIRKIHAGEFDGHNLLTKLTVRDMMFYWLLKGSPEKHKDDGNRMMYVWRHIVEYMGDCPLAALDAHLIINYVEHRFEVDMASQATIRKELGFASQAWVLFMYVENLKKDNPFSIAIKILNMTRYMPPNNKRKTRPTHNQFALLVNYMHKNESLMPRIIEFAALEGMRRGEIARMHRSHLNKGVLNIPETKTVPRKIILFPRSLEILKTLPVRQDGFFWGVSATKISDDFKQMKKTLRFENLTFHDMRHEACSRMADMKMSVVDIAAKSGHEDLNMLKRYTQLNPEDGAREYAIKMAGLDRPEHLVRFGVVA